MRQYVRLVTQVFSWRYIPVHFFAVLSTAFLVVSGLDWAYFIFTLKYAPPYLLFIADITGFIIPLSILLVSAWYFVFKKDLLKRVYASAMVYAIILGFTLSEIIKIFTGRTSPPLHFHGESSVLLDNSHDFHFGFMQEQIIGGWPSSHATVTFALVTAFVVLARPKLPVRIALYTLAFFVAVGVSFGFHWISETVAGICLGMVIGVVVGNWYKKVLKKA